MDQKDLNGALVKFGGGAKIEIDLAWGKKALVSSGNGSITLEDGELILTASVNGQRVRRRKVVEGRDPRNEWRWDQ